MKLSLAFVKGSRVVAQPAKLKSTKWPTIIKKKSLKSDERQQFIFFSKFQGVSGTRPDILTGKSKTSEPRRPRASSGIGLPGR